jgi:MoaA/NifB/PqqE/SkfB family radical SAM enzyme
MLSEADIQRCYYYLTYRCNSRCRYCDIWRTERLIRREQDADVIKRRITEMKDLGVRYIDFTGGEILLRADIARILGHAKEAGFPTIFVTNGLLYEKRAQELLPVSDFINFSLDTLDRDEYLRRRGVDGLETVLAAIKRAAIIGQQFGIIATIDHDNIEEIRGLADFAGRFETRLTVNPVFSYCGNAELTREAVRRISDSDGQTEVYINHAQLDLIASGGNNPWSPACRAMSRNIVISPDGYLLMPCFHHQTDRIFIDGGLTEVLENEMVAALRRNEGRFPFCQGCTINCYMNTANLRVRELVGDTVAVR